jgi:hypothetical protein
MRRLIVSIRDAGAALPLGPTAIATGLAILTAAILWPGVPVVTAMALAALGATSATLARFRGTAAILPIMLAHFAIYGSLYALFVGATLHAAASRSGPSLNVFTIVDLALSVFPLAIALERVWCALRAGRSTE